jgi:pyrimidine-nucleoside phosphorylase
VEEFRAVIAECGLVLAGQTHEVVPADRKLYALRDVTATVEAIPLIAGSIMSKKLAEGIDALVLDIKTGSGAFMSREEDAISLARALVGIGTRSGKTTIGFVTGMEQPLGAAIGNWLEVREAVDCLKGKNVRDLMEVTYVLGGTMVQLGGKAPTIEEGMRRCREAIYSGRALEKFLEIVRRQGGDPSPLLSHDQVQRSRQSAEVLSGQDGYLAAFDTRRIGMLAIELGAGRKQMSDVIDPGAGIVLRKKLGDRVTAGEALATFFTDKENLPGAASQELRACISIQPDPPVIPPLIRLIVDREGVRPWTTPVVF